MRTRIVEATNGPHNWGKFLIGDFDDEWDVPSVVGEHPSLLRARGWTREHILVVDVETGEGAMFRPSPHASARADLDKHQIWTCPLFSPFLEWLYQAWPVELDELPRRRPASVCR